MLDLTEEAKGESDEEIECHGIKILVDNKSLLYLERHGNRFQRRSNGQRIRLQESQRHQLMRLRKQLLGLSAGSCAFGSCLVGPFP